MGWAGKREEARGGAQLRDGDLEKTKRKAEQQKEKMNRESNEICVVAETQ